MLKFLKNLFSNENKKREGTANFKTSIVINSAVNPARKLLKEATKLKREKKYIEACEKLNEAYSSKGANELMTKERLRLPMYLQLAGKNDEGWKILNELNVKYLDVFSQAEIANQMRIFLQKEKKFKNAALFAIWSICKEVERDRDNLKNGISKKEPANKIFQDRIKHNISIEGVRARVSSLLKRSKMENELDHLTHSISEYLISCRKYDLAQVRDILYKGGTIEDNFV